jgi:hypothetical protein
VPEPPAEPALHCPTCGYNLTGLPENRCPECGGSFVSTELARERALKEASQHQARDFWYVFAVPLCFWLICVLQACMDCDVPDIVSDVIVMVLCLLAVRNAIVLSTRAMKRTSCSSRAVFCMYTACGLLVQGVLSFPACLQMCFTRQ